MKKMNYVSTRNHNKTVTAAQAIAAGISSEGGLFVPESFPTLSADDLRALVPMDYRARAAFVLGRFLTDFSAEEVSACVNAAYTAEKFGDHPAPLQTLHDNAHILELWHGPTCAFKDMALQILPHLMRVSVAKSVPGKEIVILVATSGDTGKAALEGFKDAPHTRILVFYPVDGVSPMQKLQMTTQEGNNVAVCAIRGNFDDAQSGVKAIFTDPAVKEKLAAHDMLFSSANSINWGRLVPQVVYYISAYCDLVQSGKLALGEPMNVVVPTGNFGNILAAYYAMKLGLPVKKFICASNKNHVLTDFIKTGTYDRRRDFYTTTSPSMDILISSNLERLLFDLTDRDDTAVSAMMESLRRDGCYTVSDGVREKLQALFAGGFADDAAVAATIRDTFAAHHYLIDTHTAVAVRVYEDYCRETGDKTPTVIASTANPYKFSASVLAALGAEHPDADEFEKVALLQEHTGVPAPQSLLSLREKPVRFPQVCDRNGQRDVVYAMLGIKA